MSRIEVEEAEGESYFASISDLMVGILFVFLLMLTVFALNFRQAEDDQKVARRQYEDALAREARAREEAERETRVAEAERENNARLRNLLQQAVARMRQDIEDREQARTRLLDQLGGRLKSEGVTVILDPDSGVLRLPESLLFEKGESKLGSENSPTKQQAAEAALQKISDALSDVLPCFTAEGGGAQCEARDRSTLEGVLIEGHADRQAYRTLAREESRDRNDELSVGRALTVFKGLLQRNALDKLTNAKGFPLLAVSAYGDRRPVAAGDTPEDFQKNRRIDLRFLLSARTSQELQNLINEINPALQETP